MLDFIYSFRRAYSNCFLHNYINFQSKIFNFFSFLHLIERINPKVPSSTSNAIENRILPGTWQPSSGTGDRGARFWRHWEGGMHGGSGGPRTEPEPACTHQLGHLSKRLLYRRRIWPTSTNACSHSREPLREASQSLLLSFSQRLIKDLWVRLVLGKVIDVYVPLARRKMRVFLMGGFGEGEWTKYQ